MEKKREKGKEEKTYPGGHTNNAQKDEGRDLPHMLLPGVPGRLQPL
jgi:hypothetical protein